MERFTHRQLMGLEPMPDGRYAFLTAAELGVQLRGQPAVRETRVPLGESRSPAEPEVVVESEDAAELDGLKPGGAYDPFEKLGPELAALEAYAASLTENRQRADRDADIDELADGNRVIAEALRSLERA